MSKKLWCTIFREKLKYIPFSSSHASIDADYEERGGGGGGGGEEEEQEEQEKKNIKEELEEEQE